MWDFGLITDRLWVLADQIWSAKMLNITEQGAFYYTQNLNRNGIIEIYN